MSKYTNSKLNRLYEISTVHTPMGARVTMQKRDQDLPDVGRFERQIGDVTVNSSEGQRFNPRKAHKYVNIVKK